MSTQLRLKRALSQRIYLLDFNPNTFVFAILGSISNVYSVDLHTGVCTCPDYVQRRNFCKHLFFVLYRVLKFTLNELPLPEKAEDLPPINDQMKQRMEMRKRDFYTPLSIVNAYKQAVDFNNNQNNTVVTKQNDAKEKEEEVQGDCCICFEPLSGDGLAAPREKLWNCNSQCQNWFHLECIEKWKRQKGFSGGCPLCRAPIDLNQNQQNNDIGSYINLSCATCLEFQPEHASTHVITQCELCEYCFVQRRNTQAPRHRTKNCLFL